MTKQQPETICIKSWETWTIVRPLRSWRCIQASPQLEEARVWLNGAGDVLGKEHRPLDGVVAQIFDMLTVEEEEQPPTKR